MKTTKRVIAVALAVLMLALAIPFAVSAETSYTLTVQCDKPDYTYSIYKIADFNETTGHFENGKTDAITAAIKQSTESTADVLAAATAATAADDAALGAAVGTVTFTADTTSMDFSLPAGMYFVKCTGRSILNKTVTKESVVPMPNKTESYTVNVTDKVVEGDEPTVTKKIQKADGSLVDEISASQDDTITYVLTADITGTTENKLQSYIIGDDMDDCLDAAQVNITSVKLVNGTNKTPLTYTKTGSMTSIKDKDLTYDFGISIDAAELDKDAFYTEGGKVEVIFTTKLDTAKLDANPNMIGSAIPNTDGLKYTNNSGNESEVKGNTVNVYTYKVSVNKVDADAQTTMLRGAKIGIFKTQACTDNDKIEEAITNTDGVAAFNYKFAEGTYYVKEIAAPEGYNLNTSVFEVKIEKGSTALHNGIQNTTTITDTKSKLPETGGAGTLAFTIVGGSLIVAAGILLAIVLKKRASK